MNIIPASFAITAVLILIIVVGLVLLFGASPSPAFAAEQNVQDVQDVAFYTVDHELMIEAIRQVENTPRGTKGRAGEVSDYQILPSVWAEYSNKPLSWGSSDQPMCVAEQKRVALAHCAWICRTIAWKQNAYNVALVWNAGLGRYRDRTEGMRHIRYAQRVQNIYEELVRGDVKP